MIEPCLVNLLYYGITLTIFLSIILYPIHFVLKKYVDKYNKHKKLYFFIPHIIIALFLCTVQDDVNTQFNNHFGFQPTQEISNLKSYTFLLGQSETAYMNFETDKETIIKLINRGLNEETDLTVYDFKRFTNPKLNRYSPKWWKPTPTLGSWKIYTNMFTEHDNYDAVSESMLYNTETHEVYYKINYID